VCATKQFDKVVDRGVVGFEIFYVRSRRLGWRLLVFGVRCVAKV
jgi:hypothetical protein